MRAGRVFLVGVLIAAGVGASLLLLSNGLHKLHAEGFFNNNPSVVLSTPATRPHAHARRPRDPRPSARAHRSHHPDAHRSRQPALRPRPVSPPRRQSRGVLPAGTLHTLLRAGLEIAAGLGLVALLVVVLLIRRTRRRSRREYGLYELHLSTHDQAKPQDLEDMVESIANIVRAWPAQRLRDGQPHLALELICGHAPHSRSGREMQWSINIRCQPRDVAALDGAISAAYPDVRLGRSHGHDPRPRAGVLRRPGYVMRFRKERSFVYSLIADSDQEASSPLEQIARAQVAAGAPSIVRFGLTPTPSFFEALARRSYRQHEHTLARQEHWGLPDSGLQSTFNRAEMRAAERTQNRSLFWLETVIAADSAEVCKTVAAAVQSRRGENRLHRRQMIIRQPLYRRRFPQALGPLVPSTRCLVSAAEVAHLLALPSARMKGVPVQRMTLPRIPAPPGVTRGHRTRPRTTPNPQPTPDDTANFAPPGGHRDRV